MKRYRDLFFRHPLLIAGPVVIALVASIGLSLRGGHSYTATSTVWTDSPIPNASSIFQSASGTEPPSADQEAVLSELLQSRSFLMAVARHSPLASVIARGSPVQDYRTLTSLARSVVVSTPGPQLMAVTVKQPKPGLATALATAVVRQFLSQETGDLVSRGQAVVSYDGKQVIDTANNLSKAESALASYAAANPATSTNPLNTAVNQLTSSVAAAQQQAAAAQQQYDLDTTNLENVKDASFMHVIDYPGPAIPLSRKKTLLFAGVGGLLAGIVVSIIVLLVMLATDKKLRSPADLRDRLQLNVVGTIEELRPDKFAQAKPSSAGSSGT